MVFFPARLNATDIQKQDNLECINKPHVSLHSYITNKRLNKRKLQRHMWSKDKKKTLIHTRQHTNIFKQRRSGDRLRTRFTKK